MYLYYVISLFSISVVTSLKYSEFKLLHPSCIPKDTCSSGLRSYITHILDSKFRNCYCDEFCQDYGDCCLDSKYYKENEQIERFRHFECVNVRNHGNVYMKRACMNGWENTEILQLCEDNTTKLNNSRITHQRHTPVMSKYTAITYINYYCAICNNDAYDLMVWEISLECPSLGNIMNKNSNITNDSSIEIILDNDRLGIYLGQENAKVFHECSSVPSFPNNGKSLLRKCWSAISTCLDEWSDTIMEKLCHSYTAVTYSQNKTYKNLHCAICNNIDNGHLHCRPPKSVYNEQLLAASNAKAFSILFDFFDLHGSNVVGSHCSEYEIWDSIFKKCRKIICKNSNHEYKHGKCVKMEEIKMSPTEINDYQTLATINKYIDNSTSKGFMITEAIVNTNNLIQPVTPANSFTQSVSSKSHSIKDNIKNNSNMLPSFPEKDHENNSIIAKMRNNNKIKPDSQGNDNDSKTPETNEFIKIQGLNCNQILLTAAEFSVESNDSIFVRKLKKIYYFDEYRKEGEDVLVCAEDFISYKFSYFMSVLTITGLILSCVCLLLHLFAFFSVPRLRNLAGKNLAALSATLLVSYSLFIISMFSQSNKTFCYTIALLLYYTFLSSFFWMNIISFDIWWTLNNSKHFILAEGKQTIRFLSYSIYSFGLPGIALVITVLLDLLEPSGFPKDCLPYFGKFVCWFGQRKSLLIFFAFPMVVLMACNMVCFCGSLYIIKSTQQLTVNIRSCSLYINQFRLYASLSITMGLTWITGIIAGCIQIEAAWYIFILLNTLQGVFIFGLFSCRKVIWQSLMACLFS